MRCPQCNKFVPYDTEVEPEENNSPEVSGTSFTVSYRRVLNCEECSEELKEGEIELEHDFEGSIVVPKGSKPEKEEGASEDEEHEHDWEIESCEAEPTTGSKTVDRRGRKITNPRYMATLYGVSCHVEVKCQTEGCGATAEFDVEDSIEASSMDELT